VRHTPNRAEEPRILGCMPLFHFASLTIESALRFLKLLNGH
jgi:hypothetical protein